MDNLGVREVPPRKRERERDSYRLGSTLCREGGMEGRSRWKEEVDGRKKERSPLSCGASQVRVTLKSWKEKLVGGGVRRGV